MVVYLQAHISLVSCAHTLYILKYMLPDIDTPKCLDAESADITIKIIQAEIKVMPSSGKTLPRDVYKTVVSGSGTKR